MRTERIEFWRTVTESDGGGGTLDKGLQCAFGCQAEIMAIKADSRLEAAQARLQQGYTMKVYVTRLFEPQTGDTVRFVGTGEELTIQGYRYTDETRRRYLITALEQANQPAP